MSDKSDRLYKVQIPVILTTICGLLIISEFYFPIPKAITTTNSVLISFVTIISSGALILGNILLFLSHVTKMARRRKDWYYSIIFMISFCLLTLLGLISVREPTFLWVYNNMTAAIGSTLYSLTGFYITSAAFRVFRARNWMSSVMLAVAFVVFLSYIPIGTVLLPIAGPISQWIFKYPSTSALRGMVIGVSLGVLSMTIRIFSGRQKEHLGIRNGGQE